jgi:hypothetical protein
MEVLVVVALVEVVVVVPATVTAAPAAAVHTGSVKFITSLSIYRYIHTVYVNIRPLLQYQYELAVTMEIKEKRLFSLLRPKLLRVFFSCMYSLYSLWLLSPSLLYIYI